MDSTKTKKTHHNQKYPINENYYSVLPFDDGHQSSNMVVKLATREMYGGFGYPRCGAEEYLTRSLYQNVTPNFSVTDIKQPDACVRTFTPDGKFLIAFDSRLTNGVNIYKFLGPAAANHLFESILYEHPEWIEQKSIRAQDRNQCAAVIRECIFDTFFELTANIVAAPAGFELNRECSVLTDDSRYLVVGGSSIARIGLSEESIDLASSDGNRSDVEYDGESGHQDHDPSDAFLLDYCISVIDVALGKMICTKVFKRDKIILTHNQGIYLYKNTFTVFSIKFQTIHVFNISSDGVLRELRSIGRFADEADKELFYSSVPEYRSVPDHRERFMSSLTHQLISYVYNEDKSACNKKLYRSYQILEKFHISKTQLLNETTLLLKYSTPDPEFDEPIDPPGSRNRQKEYHFFVFYDMKESKILTVEDIFCERLAEMVSSYTSLFRNSDLAEGGKYMTNPGNSFHCRKLVDQVRAKTVDYNSLVLTHYLTAYCQSFTPTPYLDHNMFTWDSSRITLLGKPRSFTGSTLKWWGRDSSAYDFQITLTEANEDRSLFTSGLHGDRAGNPEEHLFKLVFHSNAPFMISLQRLDRKHYINFHFRLETSVLH